MPHAARHPWPVILLPGVIMPADLAYAALLRELGSEVDGHTKELDLYAEDSPPPGWSLVTEGEGIDRVAADAGFDQFHLVGYSGGGAASLAYAAAHPEHLLSLALMEPAFAGWQGMTAEERAHFERFGELLELGPDEQIHRFQALQLAPGVPPVPPASDSPQWMSLRPAGIEAFLTAFLQGDLDVDALRRFDRPVWFAYGGRSHPDYYVRMAQRLSVVFPMITLERFDDRHHFDPPHRAEPSRVARSLRELWARAEATISPSAG